MDLGQNNWPSRMGNPRSWLKINFIKRGATTAPSMRGSSNNSVSYEILGLSAYDSHVLNVVKSLIGERWFYAATFNDKHLDFRSGKFLCDSDPSWSTSNDAQISFDRTSIVKLFQINELHGKGHWLKGRRRRSANEPSKRVARLRRLSVSCYRGQRLVHIDYLTLSTKSLVRAAWQLN